MNCKLWKSALPATFVAMIIMVAATSPYDFLHNDHVIFSTAMANPGTVKTVGELSISDNQILATLPAAKVVAGFLTITNKGKQNDKLIAVKFEGARKTQIHQMKMQNGVMKMRQLPGGVEIPAGKTVTLEPGGLHLMFMGLKEQLKRGQSVPVKLVFSRAGEVTLNFPVMAMMKKDGGMMEDTKNKGMKEKGGMVNRSGEMMVPEK